MYMYIYITLYYSQYAGEYLYTYCMFNDVTVCLLVFSQHLGPAEANFTDLAELISRIDYTLPKMFVETGQCHVVVGGTVLLCVTSITA